MYKLLIADDEFEIRNGLRSYFPWEEIGFEVVDTVINGTEALAYIANHPVDVLLSDIRMPDLTGIEIAKELYEQNSPIQIVFLSGYKDFEYAQHAINYGVKNYITKPTKYSELSTIFSKLKEQLDQQQKPILKTPAIVPDQIDKIIETIQNYVTEHYKDASLEGAAMLVHMNPFYISKYYKDKTGMNFSDFVVDVKMRKAAELLNDLQYKVYEISELVGYKSPKNFTRSFRKYFGKSPKEYRISERGIVSE